MVDKKKFKFEIFNYEYIWYLCAGAVLVFSLKYIFGVAGFLIGLSLFILLGIIIVNIKSMNPYLIEKYKT